MEDVQTIEKPKIYQALGIISGILELMRPPYSNLIVGDHTYSVTVSQKAEEKYEPGQLQKFNYAGGKSRALPGRVSVGMKATRIDDYLPNNTNKQGSWKIGQV
jgi:hypothetical protein